MLSVCPECRDPAVDKEVRPAAAPDGYATAVCGNCGHKFRFRYVPLFTLEGPPGVGKSTTAGLLSNDIPLAVYEGDHHIDLLGGELSWSSVCELELRIGMTLHANGRQALYVGGIRPYELADSSETRYFPRIERCALVASDEDLAARLRERPFYREHPRKVEEHLEHVRWYRERGPERGIRVVNTTELSPEAVATAVTDWIESSLDGPSRESH